MENQINILFISLILIKTFFQIYLNRRNINYVKKKSDSVPKYFSEKISLAEHQKAAEYTCAKNSFSNFSLIYDATLLLAWTWGGGINYLDHWLRSFDLSYTLRGLLFFLIYLVISIVLSLPESIYNTFVIEEKFGFNRTNAKTFFQDLIKQIFLSILLAAPLLYGTLKVMELFTNSWWFFAWLLFVSFQLLILLIYPNWIAPLFNKFSPLEDKEILDKMHKLLTKINFSYSGIFTMDASKRSSHGNAYFTGIGKTKRIVFFDTLIKTLNSDEIEAVMAHELGHYKLKHILKGMIKSILFSLLGLWILSKLANYPLFFKGHPSILKEISYFLKEIF